MTAVVSWLTLDELRFDGLFLDFSHEQNKINTDIPNINGLSRLFLLEHHAKLIVASVESAVGGCDLDDRAPCLPEGDRFCGRGDSDLRFAGRSNSATVSGRTLTRRDHCDQYGNQNNYSATTKHMGLPLAAKFGANGV